MAGPRPGQLSQSGAIPGNAIIATVTTPEWGEGGAPLTPWTENINADGWSINAIDDLNATGQILTTRSSSAFVVDSATGRICIGGTTSTFPAMRYGGNAGIITLLRADGSAGSIGFRYSGSAGEGLYVDSSQSGIQAPDFGSYIAAANGALINATGALTLTGSATISGRLDVRTGSTIAPSIATAGDPNTGLVLPGSDAFQVLTGGAVRIEVNNTETYHYYPLTAGDALKVIGRLQFGGATSTYPAMRYESSAGVIGLLRADGSPGQVVLQGATGAGTDAGSNVVIRGGATTTNHNDYSRIILGGETGAGVGGSVSIIGGPGVAGQAGGIVSMTGGLGNSAVSGGTVICDPGTGAGVAGGVRIIGNTAVTGNTSVTGLIQIGGTTSSYAAILDGPSGTTDGIKIVRADGTDNATTHPVAIYGPTSGTAGRGSNALIFEGSDLSIAGATGGNPGQAGGGVAIIGGNGDNGTYKGAMFYVPGAPGTEHGSAYVYTNNTERMRIDNAGVVFVGNGATAASPNAGIISATGGSGAVAGAALTIRGGAGGSTLAGGLLTLTGGTPTSGAGGGVAITGQAGVGTAQNGGSVTVTAGAATTSGTGGSLTLTTGVSPSGTAGSITFRTGTTAITEVGKFEPTGALLLGDGSHGGLTGSLSIYPIISYRNERNFTLQYSFSNTATDQSALQFARARGTPASPLAANSGDSIGQLDWIIYRTSSVTGSGVSIRCVADGTVDTNGTPGRISIYTTPTASIVPLERLSINNAGVVFIGNGVTAASPTAGIISGTGGSGAVAGAALTIRGGAGGSSLAGGLLTLTGGTPTSGAGGGVAITGQAGVGTAQNGGNVTITAGAATTSGTGGSLTFTTGVSPSGTAGTIIFNTGTTATLERMRISNAKTVSIGDGTIISGYGPATNRQFLVYSDASSSDENFYMQFNAVASAAPTWTLIHGRGTAAAPTATQSGDALGYIYFCGVGSTTVASQGAMITANATATHTATAWGGELVFCTSLNGASAISARWKVAHDGHLLAFVDNTYDIGASGATRPRIGYFGTSLVVPTVTAPAATNLALNAPSGQEVRLQINSSTCATLLSAAFQSNVLFQTLAALSTSSTTSYNHQNHDPAAFAADVGGGTAYSGFVDGAAVGVFASIRGRKENGTVSNTQGYCAIRTNAGSNTTAEAIRWDSAQNTRIPSGSVTGFSSSSTNAGAIDTGLSRVSAGVAALGNGTATNATGTLQVAAITAPAALALSATGASDITFTARSGSAIPFSAAAPDNALVGFTATSIVGALNEVRAIATTSIEAHTTNDTLNTGADRASLLHTNDGASGTVILTLPAAAVGLPYRGYVGAAHILRFQLASGDTMQLDVNTSTATGTLESNTVGSYVDFVALDSTRWLVTSYTGTWEVT